jgi:hypothetical protein
MNRFVVLLGVPLLLIFPSLCPAGDSKPNRDDAAVEKVVASSMEAGRKMDWKGYAELVHSESLEDYKNMWLPVLRDATKDGRDKQVDLLSLFDKATDLKSVVALKAKEFFVNSMKGMASRFPESKLSLLNLDAKIIGTVHESDDLAYVVVRVRTRNQETEVTKVDVIALKRSGTEWKLMLPDVVRTMAETLGRTAQDTQKSGPVRDRADPDK